MTALSWLTLVSAMLGKAASRLTVTVPSNTTALIAHHLTVPGGPHGTMRTIRRW